MARKKTKSSAKKVAAKRPAKAPRKKAGATGATNAGAGAVTKSIDLLRSWSPARYSTR